MKALVLEGVNQNLEFKSVNTPTIDQNETLVKIKSASFNRRDYWIRKGLYAGLKFPIILGSDGAGIVESSDNKNLIGKEVIINPSVNWGINEKVQSKDFKILGLPEDGTFAEYTKISSNNIVEKPIHLTFEQASALPLAGLTAYRALFSRANLLNGEKVLITGVGGGVALFAMQFALAHGAKVFVTSGSEEKIEKAIKLGASAGISYKETDWHKKFVREHGNFDVIVDSACGEDFSRLVDLAEVGGRIVFFGGTKGNITNISPQKVFWKQLSILGSTMGSDKDFTNMINFVNEHKIIPVVDSIYSLEDGNEALNLMENSSQFGKIVLSVS